MIPTGTGGNGTIRHPGAAFIDILLLRAAIATTIIFWQKSLLAGILMLPYLGWIGFASVLNFTIWRLNR